MSLTGKRALWTNVFNTNCNKVLPMTTAIFANYDGTIPWWSPIKIQVSSTSFSCQGPRKGRGQGPCPSPPTFEHNNNRKILKVHHLISFVDTRRRIYFHCRVIILNYCEWNFIANDAVEVPFSCYLFSMRCKLSTISWAFIFMRELLKT